MSGWHCLFLVYFPNTDTKGSSRLDTELVQLQTRYKNLTDEKDQLQTDYKNLNEEQDKLRRNLEDMTKNRNDLQRRLQCNFLKIHCNLITQCHVVGKSVCRFSSHRDSGQRPVYD